jgi:hypothetical protein
VANFITWRAEEQILRFAPSKITPRRSFPRKRESSFFRTGVDPRLRGGDNKGDFHLVGWAPGPCALRMTCDSEQSAAKNLLFVPAKGRAEFTWLSRSPDLQCTLEIIPRGAKRPEKVLDSG